MRMPEDFGFIPVKPEDAFKYHCSQCGECCKNVKESVMVESLDLFRIAKLLKIETYQAMEKYTDSVFLTEHYPVLMLKTKEPNDSCIFLNGNKCSVHEAKPRACRMYPLGAGPKDDLSDFEYLIVSKRQHHFTGETHTVKDWFDCYLTAEDREHVITDLRFCRDINILLMLMLPHIKNDALHILFMNKYVIYDTSEPFQLQFVKNMIRLKQDLEKMI